MSRRSFQKRSFLWMLMAMLCLLFLTPFTQLSSTAEAWHREATSIQKDSLTAEIEENVLLNFSELHHFLNLRMEKLSEKPTVHTKEAGLRSISFMDVPLLREHGNFFCTLYTLSPCTRIPSAIRFFIEYIRLLN